jgi:hypothetical protein
LGLFSRLLRLFIRLDHAPNIFCWPENTFFRALSLSFLSFLSLLSLSLSLSYSFLASVSLKRQFCHSVRLSKQINFWYQTFLLGFSQKFTTAIFVQQPNNRTREFPLIYSCKLLFGWTKLHLIQRLQMTHSQALTIWSWNRNITFFLLLVPRHQLGILSFGCNSYKVSVRWSMQPYFVYVCILFCVRVSVCVSVCLRVCVWLYCVLFVAERIRCLLVLVFLGFSGTLIKFYFYC